METIRDQMGNAVPVFEFGTTVNVSYSGTAGQTAAVSRRTQVVRIRSTTSCFYAIGDNPTATTSDVPLPADVIEYVKISPSQKVSAIQESSSGKIYVTECK